MKIIAIRERAAEEKRVAITPEIVKFFTKKGYSIYIEKGAGAGANFLDQEYTQNGAIIVDNPKDALSEADIILKVQPSPVNGEFNEINLVKSSAVIIGMLSPYENRDYLKKALKRGLHLIAMELVPRVTRTQNMDVLSSQSNLAGYRAVIEASYHYNCALPMMMTAAGTIRAARLLVIGVGVAGLQAIATARRLGGIVSAYDVRAATREQVESLGAKFIYPDIEIKDVEDKSGYAKTVDENFAQVQEQFLAGIIADFDVIICTAQIPGKKAPLLVTAKMVASLKPGAVIVDMATATGGNVEGSRRDQIVIKDGIKIIGKSNMAAEIAHDSSRLYAKNLYNFLEYAIIEKNINFADEIVKQMLITN